jgi:hypothetical protein
MLGAASCIQGSCQGSKLAGRGIYIAQLGDLIAESGSQRLPEHSINDSEPSTPEVFTNCRSDGMLEEIKVYPVCTIGHKVR